MSTQFIDTSGLSDYQKTYFNEFVSQGVNANDAMEVVKNQFPNPTAQKDVDPLNPLGSYLNQNTTQNKSNVSAPVNTDPVSGMNDAQKSAYNNAISQGFSQGVALNMANKSTGIPQNVPQNQQIQPQGGINANTKLQSSDLTNDGFSSLVSYYVKQGIPSKDAIKNASNIFRNSGIDSNSLEAFMTSSFLKNEYLNNPNAFASEQALKNYVGYDTKSQTIKSIIDNFINTGYTKGTNELVSDMLQNGGNLNPDIASTSKGQKALSLYNQMNSINSGQDMINNGITPGTDLYNALQKAKPNVVSEYTNLRNIKQAQDSINGNLGDSFKSFYTAMNDDTLTKSKIELQKKMDSINGVIKNAIDSQKDYNLVKEYDAMITNNPDYLKLRDETILSQNRIDNIKAQLSNLTKNTVDSHTGSTSQAEINAEISIKQNILNQQLTQAQTEYNGKQMLMNNYLDIAQNRIDNMKSEESMSMQKTQQIFDMAKMNIDNAETIANLDIEMAKYKLDRNFNIALAGFNRDTQIAMQQMSRLGQIEQANLAYQNNLRTVDYTNQSSLDKYAQQLQIDNTYKNFSPNLSKEVINSNMNQLFSGTPLKNVQDYISASGGKASDVNALSSLAIDTANTLYNNFKTNYIDRVDNASGSLNDLAVSKLYNSPLNSIKGVDKNVTTSISDAINLYNDQNVVNRLYNDSKGGKTPILNIPSLGINVNYNNVRDVFLKTFGKDNFRNSVTEISKRGGDALNIYLQSQMRAVIGDKQGVLSDFGAKQIAEASQKGDNEAVVNAIIGQYLKSNAARSVFNSVINASNEGQNLGGLKDTVIPFVIQTMKDNYIITNIGGRVGQEVNNIQGTAGNKTETKTNTGTNNTSTTPSIWSSFGSGIVEVAKLLW